jgi:undecaprenyl-diphosphatase
LSLDSLLRLDARSTAWLQTLPSRGVPRAALSIVAHSGDSLVLVPALLLLWWLDRFSRYSIAVTLGIGYIVSVLVTSIVKYAVRRRRPEGEWGALYRTIDPHSFPSGHASRTVTLSLIVLAHDLPLAGVALLAWSAVVGVSRIALGVHYLLDVLAGYLLGLAVGTAVWLWMLRGLP